tara:strand:+ start:286 stop:516 length:231 start_codon:yes stop_codon:yes gene_type:complete
MKKYNLVVTENELDTIKYAMMDCKESLLRSLLKSKEINQDEKGDFITENEHCREMVTEFFNMEAMYNRLMWVEVIE